MMPSAGEKKNFLRYYEHAFDIMSTLSMYVLWGALEKANPRAQFLPTEALYKHSYPPKDNSVPSYAVILMAIPLPIVYFIGYKLMFKTTWLEVWRLTIADLMAVALTGAVTNVMKIMIARKRPNFLFKCWPDGVAVFLDENAYGGFPLCSCDDSTFHEINKSFPSGHSSVSAAGLGFLTFVMWSQTKAFSGKCHPWRPWLSLLPAIGALFVAASRVMDNWHHPADAIVGLILGFLISLFMHQQLLPWFGHPDCDVPRDILLAQAESGMSDVP